MQNTNHITLHHAYDIWQLSVVSHYFSSKAMALDFTHANTRASCVLSMALLAVTVEMVVALPLGVLAVSSDPPHAFNENIGLYQSTERRVTPSQNMLPAFPSTMSTKARQDKNAVSAPIAVKDGRPDGLHASVSLSSAAIVSIVLGVLATICFLSVWIYSKYGCGGSWKIGVQN